MCGIAGIFDPFQRASEVGRCVRIMRDAQKHRGPDDAGVWVSQDKQVAFGHRRLSIIDLSSAGHQPMESQTGRVKLVFNGEIYNFTDLRVELRSGGVVFRGRSDSEVLANAIDLWGVEATLERISGMFAFAAWDQAKRSLVLARDHVGKKPLYYGVVGGVLYFASELRALERIGLSLTICEEALAEYFTYHYIPAPLTIYRDIFKLPPGSIITVGAKSLAVQQTGTALKTRRFWRIEDTVADGPRSGAPWPSTRSALKCSIFEATERRMLADVPVGAFLSGGIDSSLIVGVMQKLNRAPVNTFSVGFEGGPDESAHAARVAAHLGTNHHVLQVGPSDWLGELETFGHVFDEPFGDPSAIPTFLVSQLARQHVTVALSGDGGDELFLGYERYARIQRRDRLWRLGRWLGLDVVVRQVRHGLGESPGHGGTKVDRVLDLLSSRDRFELYEQVVRDWPGESVIDRPTSMRARMLWGVAERVCDDLAAQAALFDQLLYLPENILTKVDRASMAVSLEVRSPLLDRNVVERAQRIPTDQKLRDGQLKWPLRDILEDFVPRALWDRPKMGFVPPMRTWLAGPLAPWVDDLLDQWRRDSGVPIRVAPIQREWMSYKAGRLSAFGRLWTAMAFFLWYRARY